MQTSEERPRVDYSGSTHRPHPADLVVERLAWLMDNAFRVPGGYRIGLDPIIGLIPGFGDFISSLVSAVIVLQAHRAGLPKSTLLRMVANIGIDAALGSVPLVGDLFDVAFKANMRNLQLYRQARAGVGHPGRDWAFLAVLLLALGVVMSIPILLFIAAARWAVSALGV